MKNSNSMLVNKNSMPRIFDKEIDIIRNDKDIHTVKGSLTI